MEVNSGDVVLCKFYFSDLQVSKNRPVLILKDNLPFDDFVAIPMSSQIKNCYRDEHLINNSAFKSGGIPKKSKLMLRKTFVVSKTVIVKKYGCLTAESFQQYRHLFCQYFECI